jgi:voltage-gated sodium channel
MHTMTLRIRAGEWVESRPVQRFIIGLIILNAVILGLQTSSAAMATAGDMLILADQIILDFIVVAIALVPASGPLAVLRALRVLRVLRMISMMPRLRFVVEALLHAIPGISSIALLMLILFYVFAVMATSLFGDQFPQWFGSIGGSMYTLFQIMTLESWSMGIVRPVMEVYPYAWLYFIPFILIATFTMLNLFIGIIVDTMQSMHQVDHEEREHIEKVVHEDTAGLGSEIRALREELKELRKRLPEQP